MNINNKQILGRKLVFDNHEDFFLYMGKYNLPSLRYAISLEEVYQHFKNRMKSEKEIIS